MSELDDTTIEDFKRTFTGTVITPTDGIYDSARSVWNGAIDRRPAVIARCTTATQVAEAVRFARGSQLEVSVRGGGHSYAGHAVCDDGLMLDLSQMRDVKVNTSAQRAVCGGGATWELVDAATQQHGLATPGGFISHTGIGGLTLGGGVGWLTRKAGLSCDNLVSAEVVTADSRIVRASATENPDLLWALRGGGGNFGVVTSFEFALHPVGPMVNLALFFWELERGAEALRLSRDFFSGLGPDMTAFLAVALSAPPAPFVPEQYHHLAGNALLVVGFGSAEDHAEAVAPVREGLRPLFEMVTPIPYVALQQMFDASAPWGAMAYEKALYLDTLSDAVISVIAEHAPRKTSPETFCPTFALSGAFLDASEGDTAFGGGRTPGFVFNIAAQANDRATYEADRMWVRNFWDAMRPHTRGSGGYINFQTDADEDRVRASYGEATYARLARLKREWDPDNTFHLNANIRPA